MFAERASQLIRKGANVLCVALTSLGKEQPRDSPIIDPQLQASDRQQATSADLKILSRFKQI